MQTNQFEIAKFNLSATYMSAEELNQCDKLEEVSVLLNKADPAADFMLSSKYDTLFVPCPNGSLARADVDPNRVLMVVDIVVGSECHRIVRPAVTPPNAFFTAGSSYISTRYNKVCEYYGKSPMSIHDHTTGYSI